MVAPHPLGETVSATAKSEQKIFDELERLCVMPGYAHAIAHFCYRDNFVRYTDTITAEQTEHMFSMDRLIRSEISTLVGLMVKGPIDYAIPSPEIFQTYLDQTEALLKELHEVLSGAWVQNLNDEDIPHTSEAVLGSGNALREPIFYGGESAYSHQYRDFATPKYEADNGWLEANKGFRIQDAVDVVRAVGKFQAAKLTATTAQLKELPPKHWTFLPGMTFSAADIAGAAGMDTGTVERVLSALSLGEDRNSSFNALNDFNIANAAPLLPHPDGFLLFQYYSLVEALYESPFYWLAADKSYSTVAFTHRGQFTEAISQQMLERVFGANVYANVDLVAKKGEKLSEIDMLVLFGGYAIVLQAKSKRLTALARKGNDFQIKDDFKKAVQDAADQAALCSKALLDADCKLVRPDGTEITLSSAIERVFPMCVVADHYPALSFQARQFLSFASTDRISPIIATDVFALDAMTEMLRSPLRFFHYLDLRSRFGEKINAMHELTTLGFHLGGNLWVDDEYDSVSLSDDIGADLEIAMMVRRDGAPGEATPNGVLTRLQGTVVGRFIKQIEQAPHECTLGLGLALLSLGGDAVDGLGKAVERLAALTKSDGKIHDMSVEFSANFGGLTIYSKARPDGALAGRLKAHCLMKKYDRKARSWFGAIVDPDTLDLMAGVHLDFPWEHDDEMTATVASANFAPPVGTISNALNRLGAGNHLSSRQQRRAAERASKKAQRQRGNVTPRQPS